MVSSVLGLFGAISDVDPVEAIKATLMIFGVIFIVVFIVVGARKPNKDPESTSRNPEKDEANNQDPKLLFDSELSMLTYGDQSCDIPRATLMYFVCKLTFRNRRKAIEEGTVLDAYDDEYTEQHRSPSESKKAVYDAVRRVNRLAKENLGVRTKIIKYSGGSIVIAKEYK